MNSKKAKRLRQLVRHLQEKGGVAQAPWEVAGTIDHRKLAPPSLSSATPDESKPVVVIHKQRVLDPACGKAIYRQFKAKAELHGRAHG